MDRTEILATAEQLIGTIGALDALLNAEIERLYLAQAVELEEVYAQKNELLNAYANGVNSLRNGADGQRIDLPAQLSSELKAQSMRLAGSMERNMRAVAVARDASQGVVNVIINAVKRQRASVTGAGYGVNRDGQLAAPVIDGLTQAVTLDTQL